MCDESAIEIFFCYDFFCILIAQNGKYVENNGNITTVTSNTGNNRLYTHGHFDRDNVRLSISGLEVAVGGNNSFFSKPTSIFF